MRSLIICAVAAFLMAITVVGIISLQLPVVTAVILEVTCGAVVYAAANILMKNPLLIEVLCWLKNKIRKRI